MQNQLTRLLGIQYPIIQGGMMEISRARLTAAVSNAGGLGTLGQNHDLERWQEELKKVKQLTDRPFAVNLPMHASELDQRLQTILDQGVRVVVTAAGNPARILPELKAAGVVVLHVVASAEQAEKVAAAGVDAIVAEGGESGGMVARERISTLVLVPAVVDAVRVPVVAAGGICDQRGLIAALALGAQGVQMGTRFVACEECETFAGHKEGIIKARTCDTQVAPRGQAQGRLLKDEVQPGAMAGQVAGLIHTVESAQAIIERMVREAAPLLRKIQEQVEG